VCTVPRHRSVTQPGLVRLQHPTVGEGPFQRELEATLLIDVVWKMLMKGADHGG
jgi:hypothetical protein